MSHVGDDPHAPRDDPGEEGGLEQLQRRLDALQNSVEQLGGDPGYYAPPPPPGGYGEPAPAYAPPPAYVAPPVYTPPPAAPVAEPPYTGYEHPAPPAEGQPPAGEAPPAYEPQPAPAYAPTPAPTGANGQSTSTAAAIPTSEIAAGPFRNLIELRHFEEALAELEAIEDVHVRRFGQGWAEIEVGLDRPYRLADELRKIERGMNVGAGPEGVLTVEFTDVVIEDGEPAEPGPYDATEGEDEA